MTTKKKVVLSWSGGKDSSLALHQLTNSGVYDVVSLLTTLTSGYDRVSMHGLRTELLNSQCASIGLPVEKILISQKSSNEEYESKLSDTLSRFKMKGITTVVYGDLFLEEIKIYREQHLAGLKMDPLFPLWKIDTTELAYRFIDLGFKAVTVCVDSEQLGREFTGREYDRQFLSDLPPGADPCGEKGEFHTFVYDGPIFNTPISHELGEIVLRDERFYYCDILPGS